MSTAERTPELIDQARMHLKQADQLVKEHKYAEALQAVSKAKSADNKNPYVGAYEYRVRALLEQQEHESSRRRQDQECRMAKLIETARGHLAAGAMQNAIEEITRALSIDASHEGALLVKTEIDARQAVLEQQFRVVVETEIRNHLTQASSHLRKGDRGDAFFAAAQAFILDPLDPNVLHFEHEHTGAIDAYVDEYVPAVVRAA